MFVQVRPNKVFVECMKIVSLFPHYTHLWNRNQYYSLWLETRSVRLIT